MITWDSQKTDGQHSAVKMKQGKNHSEGKTCPDRGGGRAEMSEKLINSREKKRILSSEQDTEKFGMELGRNAKPGTVIALTGDLGTGKTTLTKAIARGLGVSEMITSPTFTIVREYRSGRLPLYHFDVYRIADPDEMMELGYEEYLYGNGVCVIEWADLIGELLPEDALRIDIAYGSREGERICRCGYWE